MQALIPRQPSIIDVAIVGGSLVGLATGIGLARAGLAMGIFEQSIGEATGGTGLGIDRDLMTAVTGVDARGDSVTPALPVVNEGYRETSTWLAIYRWLRRVADSTPGLIINEGCRVDSVGAGGDIAHLSGPDGVQAHILVGMDGYRSVVRRSVIPELPIAPYAGFVLWRALVPESLLSPAVVRRRSLGGGVGEQTETARLVLYRVPGLNGETSAGHRSITLAWYDASRTSWLRERGFLVGNEVIGSVSDAAVDDKTRNHLRSLALKSWDDPAPAILRVAIDTHGLFGTPLVQYLPPRLYKGESQSRVTLRMWPLRW